ncbi:MAG TPA: MFS transporter [Candidatus Binatia bacterium]|jgi:OPA family glycerol-3-phosphate transporter-like MFS transporter|nr:MFS transporter [Candidatus Binatia bacterium]
MSFTLVGLCLLAIITVYFGNNPLKHGSWFMVRRLINWFPLGMTYSFLYMGRYNLTVSKNALGTLMSNEEFGWIFGAGTVAYGVSFLVNGPLVDKIGGKRGIIIAALGAALANILLGVLTYLVLTGRWKIKLAPAFSVIYALNMYFQSYGAVSIIKVKAYWFHVRERGVFGAIFGTLISFGTYFAFDWGQAIVGMAKANPAGKLTWFHQLIQQVFAVDTKVVDATWAVFFIPAAILIVWALLDWWLIKDTPEQASFPPFDPHDASSGQMHIQLTTMDLLRKVFASRLMLLIAMIGLTSGVLRTGIMNWYFIFADQVKQPGAEFILKNWGLLLCLFGIAGGFLGGFLSDKIFQSRRGPPAALLCGSMFLLAIVMAVFLFSSPLVVGSAALLITTAVIGVHSLMSGTAAPDFGGRKATATCSGIVDGFVYLGAGLQSFSLGTLIKHGWLWWPVFLAPFALLGGIIALVIWHELPAATRKYIAEVEDKAEIELIPE